MSQQRSRQHTFTYYRLRLYPPDSKSEHPWRDHQTTPTTSAFCSHALMKGIDPRTVQKWMGHKDLKTTLGYAHVSPDHEKAAIERLSYKASDTLIAYV